MDFNFLSLTVNCLVSFYTGGVGIVKIIENIQQKEYMGFDDICTYET
jgi:hypothetical protein